MDAARSAFWLKRRHGGSPMSLSRRRDNRPSLERLEGRLQLSAAIPANSIGTSVGK